MTEYITSTGYSAPRLADIIARWRARVAANEVIADFDTADDAVFGAFGISLLGVVAEVSEASQELYDSRRPSAAEGDYLDDIVAIAGLARLSATYSAVTLRIEGTNGTLVQAGFRVSDGSTVWRTTANATINVADGPLYYCEVAAQPTEQGAIAAALGTLTTIVTPVSGVDSVTNEAAATTGRDRETDAELRVRRQESLATQGAGTDAALRARLLAISDVQACSVRSNRTLTTDGDGVPGKSYQIVIYPDDADLGATYRNEIAVTIAQYAAGGIWLHGAEEEDVEQPATGYTMPVRWDWSTDTLVSVTVQITVDADYPDDGQTQVRLAISEYIESLSVGDDVLRLRIQQALAAVPGILSATVLLYEGDPAVLDANDITVAHTSRAVLFAPATVTVL